MAVRGGAAPIPGLFPTGVDDGRHLLPAGAVDPHWRLVSRPGSADPLQRAYAVGEGYPIPPWLMNGPDSRWIAPQASQARGNSPGDYVYRLTFLLADLDASTVVLTGRWSSDNAGTEVRLNGVPTGAEFDGDFTGWSPAFTLREGFVQGTNTLEFVVNNAGSEVNPTGFRAEIAGTAEFLPPPGTPPSLQLEPTDLDSEVREIARFNVVARGSPPLSYQWRLNGHPLAEAHASTLVIASVTPAWVGAYDVIVRNAFGAVTSRVANLRLKTSSEVVRTYEPPGPSSRRTGIVISEIHHQPRTPTDGRRIEFVELYNSNPFPEDLGGWQLRGDFEWTIPMGTVLGGLGYLVIAPSPVDVRHVYGITNVIGGFDFGMVGDVLQVEVRKRSGAVVLEVEATDDRVWPTAPFGAGPSLVLVRPTYGERHPRAWAASARMGGSPGGPDPLPTSAWEGLEFSELLAHAEVDQAEFVEIRNTSAVPVDPSGCVVRTHEGWSVRLESGRTLDPGEFLVVAPPELDLNAGGGRLVLLDPEESRVLSAVRYAGQSRGIALGRPGNGGISWCPLVRATPGGPNAKRKAASVIFNELLYHPPAGDGGGEFIELFNPGEAAVAMGWWQLTDGVSFVFPADTVIAPGGFLVIAGDRDAFLATHEGLDPDRVLGDFGGALADGGERVALSRPEWEVRSAGSSMAGRSFMVEEDEVTYSDGGRWGRWSDGGGSSLERVDPRTDGRLGSSWGDSDESERAPWTTLEATGTVSLVHPGVPAADQLQVMLLGAGEALLDNVEVLVAGQNRVVNSTFEQGTAGWTFQGTHRLSRLDPTEGFESSRSLRLAASDRGDHVVNRVRTALSRTIPAGTLVTIRARVRWLRGHPEVLLRLRNGGLEASGRLLQPPSAGTAGARNSRHADHAPPAIEEVTHRPILPASGEAVRVFARVADPDGVGRVWFESRLDPSSAVEDHTMVDDGSGPDEWAGDGVYTGQIPGHATGALLAFRVFAEDATVVDAALALRAAFPTVDSGQECLVRFGESKVAGSFGNYRLWMTKAAHDRWAAREKMSNEDVPVTFVDGAHRVIHGAGAHYSGSSYTAPSYTSPTGALCGYNIGLPGDEPFLGDTQLTLDWPIRDSTDQRESLMFWFLEQLGLPNMYRRYVHLAVNGVRRGTIYDDVQQPGRDTVEEWFSDDSEGSLWKTDCWNEFGPSGDRVDPCVLNTLQRFPSSGPLKIGRYRWNWRPRAVRGSANDFSDLFELIEAVNTPGDGYSSAVEAVVDIEHWMRTFAMNDLASYWDGFGNPNAKNTFLYKPARGRWKLMCWDFDVGLGVFNDPPNAALFDVNDPALQRMYRAPQWLRHYWAALEESLGGFFRTGGGSALDSWLDARYDAFRRDGMALSNPSSIKTWIAQRRSYLESQLRTARAEFRILSPTGEGLVTAEPVMTLTGTAPLGVRSVRVNGVEVALTWTTVNRWQVRILLESGMNELHVEGIDRNGIALAGTSGTVVVEFRGAPPAVPPLRLNEWMAANQRSWPDSADGDYDDWFEIHNAGTEPVDLTGYFLSDDPFEPRRYVIPPGFEVGPQGFQLVWADSEPDQTLPAVSLHASFRLDRDGSDLLLSDPLGRVVDRVRFGPQVTDVSEGRWGDGAAGMLFALSRPTPGRPNAEPLGSWVDLELTARHGTRPGDLSLTWRSSPGRTYRVERRSDLGPGGAWAVVSEPMTAIEAVTRWPQAGAEGIQPGFYRVRLEP